MGTSKGHSKYISTPEELLILWDEYKAVIDANPDVIDKATPKGVMQELVKKPYTRQGFEAYVYRQRGHHISQYLDNNDKAYNDYLGVVTCIRREWEEDQISGTLTGKYKAPNLTARLNGISDKQDLTTNGESINEVKVNIIGGNRDK